jgi:hypothetical protein
MFLQQKDEIVTVVKQAARSVVSNHIISVATFVRISETCSAFIIRNPHMNSCKLDTTLLDRQK